MVQNTYCTVGTHYTPLVPSPAAPLLQNLRYFPKLAILAPRDESCARFGGASEGVRVRVHNYTKKKEFFIIDRLLHFKFNLL